MVADFVKIYSLYLVQTCHKQSTLFICSLATKNHAGKAVRILTLQRQNSINHIIFPFSRTLYFEVNPPFFQFEGVEAGKVFTAVYRGVTSTEGENEAIFDGLKSGIGGVVIVEGWEFGPGVFETVIPLTPLPTPNPSRHINKLPHPTHPMLPPLTSHIPTLFHHPRLNIQFYTGARYCIVIGEDLVGGFAAGDVDVKRGELDGAGGRGKWCFVAEIF